MTDGPGGPSDLEARARRLLARRPRTESELRARLADVDPERLEDLLALLRAAGWVDDRRLAEHYLLTRSQRLGHGPARLVAELERRGVPPDVARQAWETLVRRGDVDPDAGLGERIRRARETAGGRLDRSAISRLYNALLRAGFETEAVEAALRRESVETTGEAASERTDDDFP